MKIEPSDVRMPPIDLSDSSEARPVSQIKQEEAELIDDDEDDVNANTNAVENVNSRPKSAVIQLPELVEAPLKLSPSSLSPNFDLELNDSLSNSIDTKYCNICNIKFTYLKSFIAHKKFYCRAVTSDVDAAKRTVLTAATRSSPNQSSASHVTRATETPVL